MIARRLGIVMLLATSLLAAPRHQRMQDQPTPQRIAEIQEALRAHGYDPGITWVETKEVCRQIADKMEWQTDHAPDIRVLILIGLGNKYSDPQVAQIKGGRLDQDQRDEAARRRGAQ